MADTTALKNRIRAAIKANDNQEITGPVLQQTLLDIVDELDLYPEIEDEALQRQNGDTTLQQNIAAEKTRAEGAEQNLLQNISELSNYSQSKFTEVATNPILKNHTNEEIWWRGSARLFWDANTSKLYWSDRNDTSALWLIVNGKVIELTTAVKERIFNQSGNYQLLLPIPQENEGSYTLDNIVVQSGVNYDRNSYIKLAHTVFAKGISSFCIDGTQLEPRMTVTEGCITDLVCLDPEHIYDDAVIPNKNIDENGTVENYSGRNILFFKIPPRILTSQAAIVSGCTILIYSWYSGKPDYEGTNFIIRDVSNVPPANATYGAVTITNYENIKIKVAEVDPEHIYDDAVIPNKNIDENGTVENYSGRNILFFKIPPRTSINQAVIVSGCTILIYSWYSGKPDYEGTNFIIRDVSNVPPANATYGAVTITNYENIKIKIEADTETNKKIIGLYGSAINNSIGENCFANQLRTNLKILCYGNSFMRNTAHYLSAIAKNGCNVNLTIGNLYTGGTELHNHYKALVNNSADYEWHKYVDGVNTVNQTRQTSMKGLLDEHWDAIVIHQYIPWQYPFEPILNKFLKLIIERLGYTPKFYINSTWAGTLDNYESYYGFETESEMWEAMLNACEGACDDSGIQKYSIIPTGTAIQNARTLSFADNWNRFTNGNGDFHHLNPVGGFIAACTVYQKIITPLNGIPCSNTTFRIPTETYLPPAYSGQEPGIVTDNNYMLFCQAAIAAVNNPGVITTISES